MFHRKNSSKTFRVYIAFHNNTSLQLSCKGLWNSIKKLCVSCEVTQEDVKNNKTMQTQVFLDTMCQLTSWLRQAPEAQKRWVKSQKLGYKARLDFTNIPPQKQVWCWTKIWYLCIYLCISVYISLLWQYKQLLIVLCFFMDGR